jgi:hypothetical protein
MFKFPTAYLTGPDFKWRWYMLSPSGTFLAESAEAYDTCEDAHRGYELACLSLAQAS